jgi:hypothetical protein
LTSCHALVFHFAKFAAFCALALACWGTEISRAEVSDAEKAGYADAVAYCRDDVARPMALSDDKRILCYDGVIFPALDISLAKDLKDGGLFVVRSVGGAAIPSVVLANVLRDKRTTVVVYDYCLSACAAYLLVASATAFVLKDTLVAWHHGVSPYGCPSLVEAKDRGPKRLEELTCSDAPSEHQDTYENLKKLDDWFYAERTVDPLFEHPPESVVVRRILKSKFEGTGTYPPNLLWTWNPRYSASMIKTTIVYEAYPQSQDEVDAMAARLQVRVIYDP